MRMAWPGGTFWLNVESSVLRCAGKLVNEAGDVCRGAIENLQVQILNEVITVEIVRR